MGRKTCIVCGSGISSKCHITYHRIHFATTDIMKTAKTTYINPNAIPFVSKGRIQSLTSQKKTARGLKKDLEIVLSEDENVRQDSNLDECNIRNESFSTITASEGDDCENKSDRDDLHSGDRNIMEFRKHNQEAFQKKHGFKLGFMSAFMKASAYALQDQPVVNAVIDGQEIVYRDYVDISVAVATPKGLVVPVIRNVERMNFAEIEAAMAAMGEKARKGQIAVEDMDGGTFTISNGGVFGSLMGTPIINPPQSSILGMHGIFDRPIAIKGQVAIRPMMYIALTYDHRLIDGREAVFFLRKIKQGVEDPRTMLAGL